MDSSFTASTTQDHATGEANMPLGGFAPRAVARVLAHIEDNLGERLTLEGLAAVACMSRFHFARLFRSSTGYSPMGYVMRRRIDRACLLLLRGCGKLSALAADLGFCDQSHFTRAFRRATGCTPRRYSAGASQGTNVPTGSTHIQSPGSRDWQTPSCLFAIPPTFRRVE